jgi:hypothetical protein
MPRLPVLLLNLLLITGCAYFGLYRGVLAPRPRPSDTVPADLDDFARQYLESLRRHGNAAQDPIALSLSLAPSTRAEVQKAAETLGRIEQPPTSIELTHFSSGRNVENSVVPIKMVYELKAADSFYLVSLQIADMSGRRQVLSVHAESRAFSTLDENAVHLANKPLQAYVILAIAIITPVFVFCVLVMLTFRSRERLIAQLVWSLFIVTGLGTITLNWESGQVKFDVSALRFPPVTFSRPSYYSPLYVTISCPLAALIYFRRHQSAARSLQPVPDPVAGPAPGTPSS